MADIPQPLPRALWVGMALFFVLLGLAYLLSLAEFDSIRKTSLPVLGQVADFTLTNQDERVTTLDDLTNHVWVADIIFTRCAGACPVMTGQMKQLQEALPPSSPARLISLTTDPDYDSPVILQRYAQHYGANSNRWLFLTGSKTQLAGLAATSLKLGATPVALADQKSPVDLFIHSTIFVAVDKHARLRGIFETQGDGIDWTNVQPRILQTVNQLENER
jgi:cytochrome oxidase Cu insertion factor (SCO1/SenC/PrrC family)